MNHCKHFHFDGVMHTPCYQCENEQLRVENASLKADLAEAKKDAMCWYMTKQWHHADTIALIEESAKQATKGK